MNITVPSMADAPFHCPPDLVLDLPYPPSVNRLWRATAEHGTSSVYLSPSYVKWKAAADLLLLMSGPRGLGVTKKMPGMFSAEIALWPPKGHQRGDIDNRVKAVLDYAQRVEAIANDKHCQRLLVEWVGQERAPHGCRLTLRACA